MKKFPDQSFKIDGRLLRIIRQFAQADGRSLKMTIERVLRERFCAASASAEVRPNARLNRDGSAGPADMKQDRAGRQGEDHSEMDDFLHGEIL